MGFPTAYRFKFIPVSQDTKPAGYGRPVSRISSHHPLCQAPRTPSPGYWITRDAPEMTGPKRKKLGQTETLSFSLLLNATIHIFFSAMYPLITFLRYSYILHMLSDGCLTQILNIVNFYFLSAETFVRVYLLLILTTWLKNNLGNSTQTLIFQSTF